MRWKGEAQGSDAQTGILLPWQAKPLLADVKAGEELDEKPCLLTQGVQQTFVPT